MRSSIACGCVGHAFERKLCGSEREFASKINVTFKTTQDKLTSKRHRFVVKCGTLGDFSFTLFSFPLHSDPLLPTYGAPTSETFPTPPSFTDDFLPDASDSPPPGGETTTSSAGSPRFLGPGLNKYLIPIYCSILAAVVVGLVAYIVFKRSAGGGRQRGESGEKAALWPETLARDYYCFFFPFLPLKVAEPR